MDAEVLFDYDKTQEDELSFRVGQTIRNVKQVDIGWCEGEVDGLRGMFPDNFVRLIKVNLRNGEPEKKSRRAKVIFSYAAQCDDELSLDMGKVVDIVGDDEEGWLRGRLGGKEGVFPSNFVQEELESAAAAAALAVRAPSPEPTPPEVPDVDLQTGERQPPSADKPGGMRGPMVMPSFDPTRARAQLKQTSKSNVAPPSEKPPEHKKGPPLAPAPIKSGGRAKVTFDYEAENEDELTVKVGDMLEIVQVEPDDQAGWVEARFGDRKGLIAEVFFEMLPDEPTPSRKTPPPEKPAPPPVVKEPPSKQMVPPPAQKKPETKKPLVIPAKMETTDGDQADFPVPKTTPLDTSAVKDRPKTKNRPPTSRSNLHSNPEEEPPADEGGADDSAKNIPPWKLELLNKKKQQQPRLAPKPGGKASKPATSTREPVQTPMPAGRVNSVDKVSKPDPPPMARSRFNTGVSKPDPPPMARSRLNTGGSKPETNPAPVSAAPAKPAAPKPAAVNKPKPVETKSSPAPQESPVTAPLSSSNSTTSASPPSASPATPPPTVVVDKSWKEAFEKLHGEFTSFKSMVMDMVNTLTDDLDKERKQRAALEIDIDRLKKAQRSLVN